MLFKSTKLPCGTGFNGNWYVLVKKQLKRLLQG